MKKNQLGNSELFVSPFCLGTMTYGETTAEKDAHTQISEAYEAGINFIDTAEMYPTCPIKPETTGNTEKIIGNWISQNKNKRDKIVLATKIVGQGFKSIRGGTSINKKSITQAIEGSLKKLQTDYIDLYQLHWPNRGSYHFRRFWDYNPSLGDSEIIEDEINEQIFTLNNLKRDGKLRAIGLSNETCWGAMKYVKVIKNYKNLKIASIQNEYNLMCRLYDTDLNEFSINENIPLIAYSPLARGLLTGKYKEKKIPSNSRLSRDGKNLLNEIINDRSMRAVDDYINLAKEYSINPIHMALAFCKQRPFMGSVIFGATNVNQLKVILKGVDLKLLDEIIVKINLINRKHPLTF